MITLSACASKAKSCYPLHEQITIAIWEQRTVALRPDDQATASSAHGLDDSDVAIQLHFWTIMTLRNRRASYVLKYLDAIRIAS